MSPTGAPPPAHDDGTLYTAIGHHGMSICNPLGSDQLDEVIGVAAPREEGTAVDIGCGKAELLIRLAGYGCRGLGIDINPLLIAEAHDAVEARCPGRVELALADARSYLLPADTHDVASSLGASHALGGATPTLAALAAITRPGGHVLFGDGFWRRRPDDEELAVLGATRDELVSLAEMVEMVERVGLDPMHVAVTREDDLDRYDWAHLRNLDTYIRAHPDDAQAQRLWARRRAWRDVYLRAARAVMGFAVVVGRKR